MIHLHLLQRPTGVSDKVTVIYSLLRSILSFWLHPRCVTAISERVKAAEFCLPMPILQGRIGL